MKKNNRVVLGALWWCWVFFFRDRDDNYTWYGDQQTHRTHQRLILSLVWRRLSVHNKLPSHQFHVLFSFPMYFIYSLTIKKTDLQYSTVFFLLDIFTVYNISLCAPVATQQRGARISDENVFIFFFSYRYRSFASILDSLHVHIWNEIVADDGGDRIVLHVMCFVCFICVTQIWNI